MVEFILTFVQIIYLREDVQLLRVFSGFSLLTESLETNEIVNVYDGKLCMKSGFKPPAHDRCSTFSWIYMIYISPLDMCSITMCVTNKNLKSRILDVMLGFLHKCEAMIIPQAIGKEEETERRCRPEIKLFFLFCFLEQDS